jgi:hypothetical protein
MSISTRIVLEIDDPHPGQTDTRLITVDGDLALAERLGTAARTTPDELLSIPGARLHTVAEPGTLSIRAGRILAVRTGE